MLQWPSVSQHTLDQWRGTSVGWCVCEWVKNFVLCFSVTDIKTDGFSVETCRCMVDLLDVSLFTHTTATIAFPSAVLFVVSQETWVSQDLLKTIRLGHKEALPSQHDIIFTLALMTHFHIWTIRQTTSHHTLKKINIHDWISDWWQRMSGLSGVPCSVAYDQELAGESNWFSSKLRFPCIITASLAFWHVYYLVSLLSYCRKSSRRLTRTSQAR